MRIANNSHLAYCTNIHRGETWEETFHGLKEYTLAVKERVCPDDEYAIGLRLSALAAKELSDSQTMLEFRRWLEANRCYVFTINGFPYGSFHGTRVKEKVYRPDWSEETRLDYSRLLFELLVEMMPEGMEGSVSTVPGSFKSFNSSEAEVRAMHTQLVELAIYLDQLSQKSGHELHLGLEPEPLCLFETSAETIDFFEQMISAYPEEEALLRKYLGVNYDTCHLGVEFEEASKSLGCFRDAGIRLSKIHLSSALVANDLSNTTIERLKDFNEDTYLHQVVSRDGSGSLSRYEDLDIALDARKAGRDIGEEWRIHFHIPLHCSPAAPFDSTQDHLLGTLDFVAKNPDACHHFEMETYTWEVLPKEIESETVIDQLVKEYDWTLMALSERQLGR